VHAGLRDYPTAIKLMTVAMPMFVRLGDRKFLAGLRLGRPGCGPGPPRLPPCGASRRSPRRATARQAIDEAADILREPGAPAVPGQWYRGLTVRIHDGRSS